jgi:hypothetical protein
MIDLKERKPDGGLADLIEFYEEMGGEDDGEMLVLLLELRAFRRTRDKERERIAELEVELARRDAAAGEPDYYIHRVEVCDSYGPDVELRAFNNALDASKCKDDHGGEVVELFAYPPAPSAPDGWIKCSDRMPNDDTLYLGCDFDGVMWTLHFDEGQLMPDIGNLTSEITHWMELPLAPKVR